MKSVELKKRFFAAVIDVFIVIIIYKTTYITLHETGFRYAKILAVINCYVLTITFPVFIWTGQSIGKKILKIRVVSLINGQSYRVLLFVRELSKCILFTGINIITFIIFVGFTIINPKGQAIHDLITKTKVIDLKEDDY